MSFTFANLHPKYIFGLSAACKSDNVWFVDNSVILYPAGSAVVMLNMDQKSQTFLHGVEKQKPITCVAVAHNRAYAALGHIGVAEGDDASIAVFDLKSNKRLKTLVSADYKITEYISLGFTADNVHLIGLTGGPDFTCVLWKWDRSRIVAMVKATGGIGPVYDVSTSPNDAYQMCAGGNSCFKFYRHNENHLKQFGYTRAEGVHILCHAWYKTDKVIAGTLDGKIIIFERGDFRQEISINNVKNEITGALAEKNRLKHKLSQVEGGTPDSQSPCVENPSPASKTSPGGKNPSLGGKKATLTDQSASPGGTKPSMAGQGDPKPSIAGQSPSPGDAKPSIAGQSPSPGGTKPSIAGQGDVKPSIAGQGDAKPSIAGQGDPKPSIAGQGGPKPSIAGQGDPKPSIAGQGDPKPSIAGQGDPKPSIAGQSPSPGDGKQSIASSTGGKNPSIGSQKPASPPNDAKPSLAGQSPASASPGGLNASPGAHSLSPGGDQTKLLNASVEGAAASEAVFQILPPPAPPLGGDGDDFYRTSSKYTGEEITSVAAYSKGFAAAYGVGNVVIFEEQLTYTSTDDHYKQMFLIHIPNSTSESEDRIVKTLAVSPNEELLVASTMNCNIYVFQLSSVEIKEPAEMVFEFANCSYHFGAVLSLDVAIRKSLLVTCGADKFIRVWNFLTMSQEAQAEFAEEIVCVSIHPTGLFVLAGMVDKIRMFTILLNDIREMKEWPVRSCREIRFSNGGHLFAAANGNILQLYSTTTLENVANLKGHSNKIKKICWTQDDAKVITAGLDGAIYEWDVQSGRRTADLVERGSKLVSVVASPDAKVYFAVNNLFLKEIQIQEGTITQEVELGMVPTCIALSRSGKILMAAFENGTVRTIKQPLTYNTEWNEYHFHSASVNGLMCTYDEIYCISVSADNAVIIWKMTDSDGRVAKLEKELDYATEVLVTKNDLEERQVAINELKQKSAELKIEMDYALKRKDMTYQEEIRDLNAKFASDVDLLRVRIEEMEKLKDGNADEYNAYLLDVKKYHQAALDNMEAHFNTKLIAEFEKYNVLQNLLEETIQEYEGQMGGLEDDRGHAVEELVDYFESKVKDKNGALELAFNDARVQMSESEEMKRQIEEDADQEILELTTSYERKLRHEREMNAKLKGEAGIMTKKFQTMQKEIEERMNEVQRLHSECAKLTNTIKTTEKEVVQLQRQMVDSDAANMEKEKNIQELQKSNYDLDKFKFVLEHRIKELRKNIDPKAREIIYLKQQNADMEHELDSTISVRGGFQLQVSELQNKLKMADHEMNMEKKMRMRLQVLIERIRSHMARCMSVLHDHKKLKATVKAMYAKYGDGMEAGKASTAEQEAICELVRQKHHLEISLTSVKRKLAKDAQFTRTEQLKIMHENMMLVYEINNLRTELKRTRDKVASYEKALGFSASHPGEAAEMRYKLQHAIEERDEIDIAHEAWMETREGQISAQQEEIDTLSTKILKVHEYVHDTTRPDGMSMGNAALDHIRAVLNSGNTFLEAEKRALEGEMEDEEEHEEEEIEEQPVLELEGSEEQLEQEEEEIEDEVEDETEEQPDFFLDPLPEEFEPEEVDEEYEQYEQEESDEQFGMDETEEQFEAIEEQLEEETGEQSEPQPEKFSIRRPT